MKFSIRGFFSKCNQIRRKLRICSHLLNKSLIENLIFCAVGSNWIAICYIPYDCQRQVFYPSPQWIQGSALVGLSSIFRNAKLEIPNQYPVSNLKIQPLNKREHRIVIANSPLVSSIQVISSGTLNLWR